MPSISDGLEQSRAMLKTNVGGVEVDSQSWSFGQLFEQQASTGHCARPTWPTSCLTAVCAPDQGSTSSRGMW